MHKYVNKSEENKPTCLFSACDEMVDIGVLQSADVSWIGKLFLQQSALFYVICKEYKYIVKSSKASAKWLKKNHKGVDKLNGR